MEVRSTITGKTQTLSQDDWKTLQATGHAKNFTVLQAEDFEPAELSLPPSTKKDKPKEANQ